MDPFLGEVRCFGFNYAPKGWMQCSGQLLSIAQNSALYSLLGTTYGGDGRTTFALPNLNGRVALNQGTSTTGTSYTIGQVSGVETVTLLTSQMPIHNHAATLLGNSEDADQDAPGGHTFGTAKAEIYNNSAPQLSSTLNQNTITIALNGGSQPHENMQPYLVMNYCIAISGVYPSRP